MTRPLAIFDMDGTLTRAFLDFDAIRDEIGLPEGPILEAVRRMEGDARARAEAILHRREAEAAAASELQPDAHAVLATLRSAGIPIALMTRNSRIATTTVCDKHGLCFDLIRTRDDGVVKPSPEPVLAICRALETPPRDAWVIGDFHYDILCGRSAGARTVLFLEAGLDRPAWAADADHIIATLMELPALMGIR